MTRTDPHSPINLVTEDYVYVESYDSRVGESMAAGGPLTDHQLYLLARLAELRELTKSSPLPERGLGQCHHCGARIRYGAVLRHLPTGNHIAVGETCLDNRFERATGDFQAMRKAAELDRKAQRIVQARLKFVTENPDLAWLNEDADAIPEAAKWSEFVRDLRHKFQTYGELSIKQADALRRTLARSADREANKAPEPTWIAAPPEGRQEVTGVVLALKVYEDDQWGDTTKMLLKVGPDSGCWKLWTTCPAKLLARSEWVPNWIAGTDAGEYVNFPGVERGDEVTIKVTVTHSDDDPTFARGSRPTVVTPKASK